MKTADSGVHGRGWGIVAAGVFAIVAGLGEIIVGVTGNYLGILSKSLEPSSVTALVGACYSLRGAFILTSTKWGAAPGHGIDRRRDPWTDLSCRDGCCAQYRS